MIPDSHGNPTPLLLTGVDLSCARREDAQLGSEHWSRQLDGGTNPFHIQGHLKRGER